MNNAYDSLCDLLARRYSCRAFLPDPVPDDVLERIVKAAGHVPSWCNAQPWAVTLTRGSETHRFREALMDAAEYDTPRPDLAWPTTYPGLHQTRRQEFQRQLHDAVSDAQEDNTTEEDLTAREVLLFGAPHVAIIHAAAESGPYGTLDCGGFVTALMLAATAQGVASIAQASVAAYAPMIRAYFDLPDNRLVLCAISLGYQDRSAPENKFRTPRAALNEIYDPRG